MISVHNISYTGALRAFGIIFVVSLTSMLGSSLAWAECAAPSPCACTYADAFYNAGVRGFVEDLDTQSGRIVLRVEQGLNDRGDTFEGETIGASWAREMPCGGALVSVEIGDEVFGQYREALSDGSQNAGWFVMPWSDEMLSFGEENGVVYEAKPEDAGRAADLNVCLGTFPQESLAGCNDESSGFGCSSVPLRREKPKGSWVWCVMLGVCVWMRTRVKK